MPSDTVRYPEEFLEHAINALKDTSKQLRILSHSLDADIYHDASFVSELSKVIRSHRSSIAQIIVLDERCLRGRRHRLIDLARKVPSLCQVRCYSQEPERYAEEAILFDRDTVLYRHSSDEHRAFFRVDARAEAKSRIDYFDYLWQRAETSPELRDLGAL